MWVFFASDLASINGDGAAQPVPSATEQQESSSSDQTNDSDGASWPAPFEMPSSVSEDPSASSQVRHCLDANSAKSFKETKPIVLSIKNREIVVKNILSIYVFTGTKSPFFSFSVWNLQGLLWMDRSDFFQEIIQRYFLKFYHI